METKGSPPLSDPPATLQREARPAAAVPHPIPATPDLRVRENEPPPRALGYRQSAVRSGRGRGRGRGLPLQGTFRQALGPDGASGAGFAAGRGRPEPVSGDAEAVDEGCWDEFGEERDGEDEEDGAGLIASSESDHEASEIEHENDYDAIMSVRRDSRYWMCFHALMGVGRVSLKF